MEAIIKRLEQLESRVQHLELQVADLETQKRGKRFVPPSVAEVRSHCLANQYTFDPETFTAFYETKNWKVGNAKMKSWQSACVTWQKREAKSNEGNKSAYQQRVESDSARANDFAAARHF